MEMIIIRSLKTATAAFPGAITMVKPVSAAAPTLAVHAPLEVVVEKQDLSGKDAVDAQRDPRTIGFAPPMPTYLIKGIKAGTSGSPQDATKAPAISWGIEHIKAQKNSGLSGVGATVAVLDTGIDEKHPAFAGMKLEKKNFTTETDGDIDGHGTHCAGTIFGRDVAGTRIGVARGVEKALIGKVIGNGGGSTFSIISAINWAWAQGANVISMSLGIDFPGYAAALEKKYGYPPQVATSMALAGYVANVRAFDSLSALISGNGQGVIPSAVLTAATGNESMRDQNKSYKISVSPPAAGAEFLSVSAIMQAAPGSGQDYTVAPFSNIGGRIAAPGFNIWSAKAGGGLVPLDGTSMATPHVAGVAAMWAEQLRREERRFDAREVVRRIESHALGLQSLGRGDVGAGLVQAPP